MKYCSGCKHDKPVSEFGSNKAKADGLQVHCKECRKSYNAAYYTKTKDIHNPTRYARKKQYGVELRNKICDYLIEHPCTDCGETDIVVLQFDHQHDKIANLSVMIGSGLAWSRILREIEKCQVVCANCHMRRTAKTQKWFRLSAP
jgi:hypothetical protein